MYADDKDFLVKKRDDLVKSKRKSSSPTGFHRQLFSEDRGNDISFVATKTGEKRPFQEVFYYFPHFS